MPLDFRPPFPGRVPLIDAAPVPAKLTFQPNSFSRPADAQAITGTDPLQEKVRQLQDAFARHREELIRLVLATRIGCNTEDLPLHAAGQCRLEVHPTYEILFHNDVPVLRFEKMESRMDEDLLLHFCQRHQILI